jgi:hypothetical protein
VLKMLEVKDKVQVELFSKGSWTFLANFEEGQGHLSPHQPFCGSGTSQSVCYNTLSGSI